LTSVFLTDNYTTTFTISTSFVLYLYMDTQKIKWMNECTSEDMGPYMQKTVYKEDYQNL